MSGTSNPGFWRGFGNDARNLSIGGYSQLGRIWYLAPQGGYSLPRVPSRNIFTTFAALKPNLKSRDTIFLIGVLKEQAVAPDDICDVSVIGIANRPRQATSGGVPTGGGAYWTAPSSPAATTPLLELVAQGWNFQNICFNPVASSAALRLTADASDDSIDGGHATIDGCYFVGGGSGQIGIEDNGGTGFVRIANSRFLLLASAILGLTTSKAVPLMWEIENNSFAQNTNDVKMSLSYGQILKNRFLTVGAGATNKVISTVALSGQGGNNQVLLNQFSNVAGEIQISNGYSGSSTDTWNNYANGTAALIVTSPPGA